LPVVPYLGRSDQAIGSLGAVTSGQQLTARDNALAETTIRLYKTESIREDSPVCNGPIGTLADVEHIACAWVSWYDSARLMGRLGRRRPG
jgi:hypothetical protein